MKDFRIHILFLAIVFFSFTKYSFAQIDTAIIKNDSLQSDTLNKSKVQGVSFDYFLKKNQYLNKQPASVALPAKQKAKMGKEFLFYLLSITLLLVALFKVFYTRYFNNIFRVFFNTSLRQNQLSDLLLQAKLPSLIFNTFFAISAGIYVWLIFIHYQLINQPNNYIYIALSVLCIALIYFGKYLSIKIIGWISGASVATDKYIFVIFLINKIIGIILIPFIILLAFAPPTWLTIIIISSYVVIGTLFLLRYLRSYGLLQNELRINPFHFLLYIIGMELLPIMLIYKVVTRILL